MRNVVSSFKSHLVCHVLQFRQRVEQHVGVHQTLPRTRPQSQWAGM
jgi:hypothetical protein